MRDARGKAEVIIAKQRHGPTGTVAMTFQGEFTRFFDLAERSHLPTNPRKYRLSLVDHALLCGSVQGPGR